MLCWMVSSGSCLTLRHRHTLRTVRQLLPTTSRHPTLVGATVHCTIRSNKGYLHPVLILATSRTITASSKSPRTTLRTTTTVRFLRGCALVRSSLPSVSGSLLHHNGPAIRTGFNRTGTVLTNSTLRTLTFGLLIHPASLAPRHAMELMEVLSRTTKPGKIINKRIRSVSNRCLSRRELCFVRLRGATSLFGTTVTVNTITNNKGSRRMRILSRFKIGLKVTFRVVSSLLSDASNGPGGSRAAYLGL